MLAQALVVLLLILELRHPPLLLQRAGALLGLALVTITLALVAVGTLPLLGNAALLLLATEALAHVCTSPIVCFAQRMAAIVIRDHWRPPTVIVPVRIAFRTAITPAALRCFALFGRPLLAQGDVTLLRTLAITVSACRALVAAQSHFRAALLRLPRLLPLLDHVQRLLARVCSLHGGARLRLALGLLAPHVLACFGLPRRPGAGRFSLGLHLDGGPRGCAAALTFRALGVIFVLGMRRHDGNASQRDGDGKCAEGLRAAGECHLDTLV